MADQCRVSAAVVAESEESSYVLDFKVHGYSRSKELRKSNECVVSPPYCFGGYNWVLTYYPKLPFPNIGNYIHVILDSVDAKDVKAKARFSVLDKDGVKVEHHSAFVNLGNDEKIFPSNRGGFDLLINQAVLEQLAPIIDDCLSIRCDLTLIKNISSEEKVGNQFVVVPPSDLHLHFGNLLRSMDGANVTFHVGGEMFPAHRTVLAARSSVFRAELLGTMKGEAGGLIEIHEMEADVLKYLLHFIYTDSLPDLELASNEDEAWPDVVVAGHLLVAADRYNIGRLKLICEHKLCSHIDANMVATSLALAEQNSCNGLRKLVCSSFLLPPI